MLLWRDLGAVRSNDSPPSGPPTQVRGPRRRPSTERSRRICDSHTV
jgi:hypothetical protein